MSTELKKAKLLLDKAKKAEAKAKKAEAKAKKDVKTIIKRIQKGGAPELTQSDVNTLGVKLNNLVNYHNKPNDPDHYTYSKAETRDVMQNKEKCKMLSLDDCQNKKVALLPCIIKRPLTGKPYCTYSLTQLNKTLKYPIKAIETSRYD